MSIRRVDRGKSGNSGPGQLFMMMWTDSALTYPYLFDIAFHYFISQDHAYLNYNKYQNMTFEKITSKLIIAALIRVFAVRI